MKSCVKQLKQLGPYDIDRANEIVQSTAATLQDAERASWLKNIAKDTLTLSKVKLSVPTSDNR